MSAAAAPLGKSDVVVSGRTGDCSQSVGSGATVATGVAQSAGHARHGCRTTSGKLTVDTRLAEEAGRRMGPAVLATGGIGRQSERSCVITRSAGKPLRWTAAINDGNKIKAKGRGDNKKRPPSLASVLATGIVGDGFLEPSCEGTERGLSNPAAQQFLSEVTAPGRCQTVPASIAIEEAGNGANSTKRGRSSDGLDEGSGSATRSGLAAKNNAKGALVCNEVCSGV